MFGDGDFSDLNNVIKTCACTIYMASVSHGAVNFGQYDEYAFPPFYPGILTGKPPDNKVKFNTPNVLWISDYEFLYLLLFWRDTAEEFTSQSNLHCNFANI